MNALSTSITEAAFQAQVLELLRWNGWLVYHTRDSRGSAAGYPDISAVHREHGLLFAELKTESGKASREQQTWLDLLHTVAAHLEGLSAVSHHRGKCWYTASGEGVGRPRVVVGLFRPSAFDWLEAIAKGLRP